MQEIVFAIKIGVENAPNSKNKGDNKCRLYIFL
jgi:hypothetical protein